MRRGRPGVNPNGFSLFPLPPNTRRDNFSSFIFTTASTVFWPNSPNMPMLLLSSQSLTVFMSSQTARIANTVNHLQTEDKMPPVMVGHNSTEASSDVRPVGLGFLPISQYSARRTSVSGLYTNHQFISIALLGETRIDSAPRTRTFQCSKVRLDNALVPRQTHEPFAEGAW